MLNSSCRLNISSVNKVCLDITGDCNFLHIASQGCQGAYRVCFQSRAVVVDPCSNWNVDIRHDSTADHQIHHAVPSTAGSHLMNCCLAVVGYFDMAAEPMIRLDTELLYADAEVGRYAADCNLPVGLRCWTYFDYLADPIAVHAADMNFAGLDDSVGSAGAVPGNRCDLEKWEIKKF